MNGKGDSSRAVIESRNQKLQIYRDKGDNQDARRKLSFLRIPLISMRCSALLIVTCANRFDIRVVVVWNAPMRFIKSLPNTILALLLTGMIFVPISQLQAGASNKSGNPYGNGSFFPNNGTFSAIERSSNGFLGVLQFSTTSTNSSPSTLTNNTGIATIYAEGTQFIGSAFGNINSSASTIACTYSGNGVGQTYQLQTVTSVNDSNGNSVGVEYGLTNASSSNNINGQFSAKLANSYPNQIFSGSGQTRVNISSVTSSIVATNSSQKFKTVEYIPTNSTVIYNTTVSGSRLTTGSF